MPELEIRPQDYSRIYSETGAPYSAAHKRGLRPRHGERPTVSPPKPPKRFGLVSAIVSSLLLHALLLLALFTRELPPPRPTEALLPPVEVTTEDALDEEQRKLGEVVSTERSDELGPPRDTRFLSERDQTVEKETQRPVPTVRSPPAPSRDSKSSIEPGPSMGDLGIAPTKSAMASLEAENDVEPVDGESLDSDWNVDSLDNVPMGPRSLLNTKRYAHFAYYRRIKQKLAPLWQPEVQRRMRALWISGRVPKEKKLKTAVAVGVDSQGSVKFVELVNGSGITTVDDAAIEAFFEARNFPNPPHALLNEAGELAMRWNFVVDVDGVERLPLPEETRKRSRDYR